MDLFFYIAIIGAFMMMLSRIQYKKMSDRSFLRGDELVLDKKRNNFFVKIKNSFLYDLFYSREFARMNRTYGTLMVLIGIGGMLLFKTIGIILVVLFLIVLFFYLFKFIVKLIKSTKSY